MTKETNRHRKIWFKTNGEIPKDEYGNTYHIHHKDRDRNNNSIDNLECISVIDHFKIHLDAEEYQAANAIFQMYFSEEQKEEYKHLNTARLAASQRDHSNIGFNNPELFKRILEEQNRKILNGTFHLQSGEIQSRWNYKKAEEGTHNFMTQESRNRVTNWNKTQLSNGTHPFQNMDHSAIQKEKVSKGTHHFQTDEHSKRVRERNIFLKENNIHPFQSVIKCSYCGTEGRGFGFHSKHNEYCLLNPNNQLEKCVYCFVSQHPSIIKRYHNDKCKFKK